MAENTEFYFSLINFGEFLERTKKYVKKEKVNEFMDEFFAFMRNVSKEVWRFIQEGKCFECAFYEVMNSDANVKKMERIRKKYIKKEVEKELEKEKKREELTYIG